MRQPTEEPITPTEAAKIVRKSADWLYRRRKSGEDAPPHHKIGGRFFYYRSEVLEWRTAK